MCLGSEKRRRNYSINGDCLFELMRMVVPSVERWMVRIDEQTPTGSDDPAGGVKNDRASGVDVLVVADTPDRQVKKLDDPRTNSGSSSKKRRLNLA